MLSDKLPRYKTGDIFYVVDRFASNSPKYTITVVVVHNIIIDTKRQEYYYTVGYADDKFAEKKEEELFQDVNTAYATLTNK